MSDWKPIPDPDSGARATGTRHFNNLSEAESERLAILAEECGEVIQAVCKILRHGYERTNPDEMPETNRMMLERELGDVRHAVQRMEAAADVNSRAIRDRAALKPRRIEHYLHHQQPSASTGI